MNNIELLQKYIDESNRIVFFGGAGVSTESGIPDFRSVDGLYNQKYDYPPEYILSHEFYMTNKKEFYRFYRDKMIFEKALPNECHKKLAELEKMGKLSCVITQNIDGLHYLAGSKKVYELHGSVKRYYCEQCGKFHDSSCLKEDNMVPKCSCGGDIKPDVVLYNESLDYDVMKGAIEEISRADLLIVGGTSLTVYPASGFINYFNKEKGKIVLINKSKTSYDNIADLIISDKKIGEVFKEITL